jgi:citrate lyase subunit beta/citryl-CoA lyase
MAADARAAGPLHGAVLFTPGDRAERFDKGWAASEGLLILDLEDAVTPEGKPGARAGVSRWVRDTGRLPLVRVNAADTPSFAEDCAALAGLRFRGVIVPKVEDPASLEPVRAAWPGTDIFPLVESPSGLENAAEIARTTGVRQLMLGALDLHASCGVEFPQPALMEHARLRLMLASRIAGIAPPVDSPHPGVRDLEELVLDTRAAVALGFAAKLCIHPAQVAPVNAAFEPSPEQLAWAREVLAAVESQAGVGAVQVRGRMVDAPVVASARHILRIG